VKWIFEKEKKLPDKLWKYLNGCEFLVISILAHMEKGKLHMDSHFKEGNFKRSVPACCAAEELLLASM